MSGSGSMVRVGVRVEVRVRVGIGVGAPLGSECCSAIFTYEISDVYRPCDWLRFDARPSKNQDLGSQVG